MEQKQGNDIVKDKQYLAKFFENVNLKNAAMGGLAGLVIGGPPGVILGAMTGVTAAGAVSVYQEHKEEEKITAVTQKETDIKWGIAGAGFAALTALTIGAPIVAPTILAGGASMLLGGMAEATEEKELREGKAVLAKQRSGAMLNANIVNEAEEKPMLGRYSSDPRNRGGGINPRDIIRSQENAPSLMLAGG